MSIGIFELNDVGVLNTNEGADTLVILLHAYQKTPRYMQPLVDAIRGAMPNCDILAPRLPMRTTSFVDPEDVASLVLKAIDGAVTTSHTTIILIGHSMGAVLARKVWALAWGATRDGKLDASTGREWAPKIKRIIQLAAFNRGWTLSSPLDPWERLKWTIGTIVSNAFRYGARMESLAFGFRRGSAFLTRTRLQILEVSRNTQSTAETYQLLGTGDDLVAPSDHVDFATTSRFHYIEAEGATHSGIINLTEGDGGTRAAFLAVLTGNDEETAKYELPPVDAHSIGDESADDFDAVAPPETDADVKQVVFVIHGIRDRGYWTRRLARDIVREATARNIQCRTVTSTYGYFAMGPFLLPWVRRKKVEWLMDQYVTARALYPGAEISYIGHSNGTYLLAKALELCEAIKVKNVVFAGSVVQTGYDWGAHILAKRVGEVVNYVATKDWVVAIFPNGLEKLRAQDLGGAGHYGFSLYRKGDVAYVDGSHGEAITFRYWPQIIAFVLSGTRPSLPTPPPQQPWWSRLFATASPGIWVAIVVSVLAGGGGLLFQIATGGGLFWLAIFLLYLFLIWLVLNKF
jgi:pimeloyl-ACP methyl ester carboxylesterase